MSGSLRTLSATVLFATALVVLTSLSMTTNDARSAASTQTCMDRSRQDQQNYPEYHLSPLQSLRNHDAVFLGEVVVASKPCSLGYCAGIRLKQGIKGEVQSNTLVQVARPRESNCPPRHFNKIGETWIVFANRGTSRTGFAYVYADDEGPSFQSSGVPDFEAMDTQYLSMQRSLDHAIEATLGPVRVNAATAL